MGLIGFQRSKDNEQAKQKKELRRSHSRGLDCMPASYKAELLPKLIIVHLLHCVIPGALVWGILSVLNANLQRHKTAAVVILAVICVVPLGFLLRHVRRLLETLTLRFDVFGGAVTDFERESHEHRDSKTGKRKYTYTYFVKFNNDRRKVSALRFMNAKFGDYFLLARYMRHYEMNDVYISFKASPGAEENRLTSDFPVEPVRLYFSEHMPTWTVVLSVILAFFDALLLALAYGIKGEDSLLWGQRPDFWLRIGLVIAGVIAGIAAYGLHVRFTKERKALATRKHIREGGSQS